MTDITALEARVRDLEDIEALKKLKAKYFRCLDNKLWDEMAECFTDNATTEYADGQIHLEGREQIIDFLKKGLGRSTFFGFHQAHHPEISLLSDGLAKGIWYSHYYMIDTVFDKTLHCGAFYQDSFVKEQGQWKIESVGYTRIFEESWDRDGVKGLQLGTIKDFTMPSNPPQ